MFSTAVCVLFLIKLRCPKNKSLYDIGFDYLQEQRSSQNKKGQTKLHGTGIHFPEKIILIKVVSIYGR